MNPHFFCQKILVAGSFLISSAHAVTITVGDDSDLMPAGPTPNLDSATPMIVVDYQANLYTNSSGDAQAFTVDTFEFFAQGDGDVTPFVALLTGAGTAAEEYDVLALGATRVGGGADFTAGGVVSVPFGGSLVVTIPDGATLVGGIRQGATVGNVVPFNSNAGLDTFITGGAGGEDASDLTVAGDIIPGGSTWSTLNGGRNYEFTIELNTAEDADGDGLPDDWEDANGLDKDDNGENPNNNGVAGDPDNGATGDPDGDGLDNQGEFVNASDPNDPDSDDDMLGDNDEVLGAGDRPPTLPGVADSDEDTLSDLVETNTGIFVDENDTGSDPTVKDTDGDTIDDADEVAGNNEAGFTSDPNLADTDGDTIGDADEVAGNNEAGFISDPSLADTDGDGAPDPFEIAAGTDPNDSGDRPSSVFVGDAAPLFGQVTDLGGADTANAGSITYALQGFPYKNESGGAEMFEIASVNFWADAEGDVTPFLATYNGNGIELASNYVVLAVGDPITATAAALNNAEFTVDGAAADITVEDGETVVAGFHQTARVVPFGEPGDANADFLDEDNEIGEVGAALTEDAQWSALDRTYAFNIELESGATTEFEIVDISVDTGLGSATVTWRSRPGAIYSVWASEDLQNWAELDDNVAGAAGQMTTSHTESPLPPSGRRRYYQVRLQ